MIWYLIEQTQMKVWAAAEEYDALQKLKEELSNDPEFKDAEFVVTTTDCGCSYSSKAIKKEFKRILELGRKPKSKFNTKNLKPR